jgi:DNA-nicking Smr family endonuclease
MRGLSPADRALWRRLAATVRPLRSEPQPDAQPAAGPAAPAADAAPTVPATGGSGRLARAGATRPPPAPPPPPPLSQATLDGAWDRRLAQGRIEPELTVDLHGHGEAAAHALVEARLAEAAARGLRLVLVITGKGARSAHPDPRGRGVLRRRLPEWLELARTRPLVAAIRPAHPRHGGAGAVYIVLRRARPGA